MASWLYLGGVVQRVKGNRLDTVEIDIGVVGPPALGEQAQSRCTVWSAWRNPRVGDNSRQRARFSVAYLQKRKYGNAHFEVVPMPGLPWHGDDARARRRHRAPRAKHDRVRPRHHRTGGVMLQNTRREHDGGAGTLRMVRLHRRDVRYVARNIFLDGTVFHESFSVDARNVVRDAPSAPPCASMPCAFRSRAYSAARSSPPFRAAAVSRISIRSISGSSSSTRQAAHGYSGAAIEAF